MIQPITRFFAVTKSPVLHVLTVFGCQVFESSLYHRNWKQIFFRKKIKKFSNQLVQGNQEPKKDNSVQNFDAKERSYIGEELLVENPISGNISQAPGTKDFQGQLEHTGVDAQSFPRKSASGNCHSRRFLRSWKNNEIQNFYVATIRLFYSASIFNTCRCYPAGNRSMSAQTIYATFVIYPYLC